ncbi:MAG: hypothetical protein JJU24_05270 [Natronohydrobacter sp.]|nr:hypothetical protein [Natronohydrobacter sp.]
MRLHGLFFLVFASLALGAAGAVASEWRVTENTDRFTDEVTHSVHIQDQGYAGLLDFSCEEGGDVRAIFLWFSASGLHGPEVQVEWRLGSRPRGVLSGRPAPTGDAVWSAESVTTLIDDLLDGEQESTALIVRSRGNLLEFDIMGFGAAYEDLMSRCRL